MADAATTFFERAWEAEKRRNVERMNEIVRMYDQLEALDKLSDAFAAAGVVIDASDIWRSGKSGIALGVGMLTDRNEQVVQVLMANGLNQVENEKGVHGNHLRFKGDVLDISVYVRKANGVQP